MDPRSYRPRRPQSQRWGSLGPPMCGAIFRAAREAPFLPDDQNPFRQDGAIQDRFMPWYREEDYEHEDEYDFGRGGLMGGGPRRGGGGGAPFGAGAMGQGGGLMGGGPTGGGDPMMGEPMTEGPVMGGGRIRDLLARRDAMGRNHMADGDPYGAGPMHGNRFDSQLRDHMSYEDIPDVGLGPLGNYMEWYRNARSNEGPLGAPAPRPGAGVYPPFFVGPNGEAPPGMEWRDGPEPGFGGGFEEEDAFGFGFGAEDPFAFGDDDPLLGLERRGRGRRGRGRRGGFGGRRFGRL